MIVAGLLVAKSRTLAVSATPTFLSSSYAGLVDAVGVEETVVRPTNTDFVMDDVAFYAEARLNLLPSELISLGLFGFCCRKRLRRAKQAGLQFAGPDIGNSK